MVCLSVKIQKTYYVYMSVKFLLFSFLTLVFNEHWPIPSLEVTFSGCTSFIYLFSFFRYKFDSRGKMSNFYTYTHSNQQGKKHRIEGVKVVVSISTFRVRPSLCTRQLGPFHWFLHVRIDLSRIIPLAVSYILKNETTL